MADAAEARALELVGRLEAAHALTAASALELAQQRAAREEGERAHAELRVYADGVESALRQTTSRAARLSETLSHVANLARQSIDAERATEPIGTLGSQPHSAPAPLPRAQP